MNRALIRGWRLLPLLLLLSCGQKPLTDFVDPRIGSEGLGRTFIGPACPYGMVKPSPDCTSSPNSGWLPAPAQVNGFAQVHVSGTGGGPKYGNILIQPFSDTAAVRIFHRKQETILPGYYATEFEENGIRTEITTAPRVSYYRIRYPDGIPARLRVDLGFFLGENPVPKAREAQQFEGSFCQIDDAHTVSGWQCISGGWNNGAPYTVYFCLESDTPFAGQHLWETPEGKSGAEVDFGPQSLVNLRIGISFLSIDKAREHLRETAGLDFDAARTACLAAWEDVLSRVKLARGTPEREKRMFYTGLYHTMLMPVDRTGEWAPAGEEVYYDDFYALWDTYRSSLPLITLLDPERERDIVNALLTIYRHDGYLPDARSGNSNGRTQGGSNAEIVIADAFAKGLAGIDYALALDAMCKDAEVAPADDEAEGRGGLAEYRSLGYIPWGIPRAGNRTLEYASCDDAIARVAEGLGREDLAREYAQRSRAWRNLWRADYEDGGVRGFILPRDENGAWLDELPFGHSNYQRGTYRYTPTTFEGPWYTPWWSDFFYEADSWEYSLAVPHDVPGLVEICGGAEAFEQRLDRFFDDGHYHVENEPSFLTSCLYHWIGRPDKSSERTREIIERSFGDGPRGLPGNDDSGAMSSWLAFHMMGLYPLAGTDRYVVHVPLLRRTVLQLPGGKRFVIRARGLSARRHTLREVRLNGRPLPLDSLFLHHADLLAGGTLSFRLSRSGPVAKPLRQPAARPAEGPVVEIAVTDSVQQSCRLHGQTRRFAWYFTQEGDSLRLHWRIERNLRMWRGSYTLLPEALESGRELSLRMPEDGLHVTLGPDETFGILPRERLRELKSRGSTDFAHTRWHLVDSLETALTRTLIHARDLQEGAEIWVLDYAPLPLIWRMRNNPMEVDWDCSSLDPQHRELLADADKCGSVFYAYPEPEAVPTPAPAGFKPFYISHYGRHGSRYQGSDDRYKDVLDYLEMQGRSANLTPFGQDVLARMRTLWSETEGHGGMLSGIGAAQHRAIAARMAARFPAVFPEGAVVEATSSTAQRCQDSMNAFCESLLEAFPSLELSRRSDEQTFAVLVPANPQIDSLEDGLSPWWEEYFHLQEANLHPGRLTRSLFVHPDRLLGVDPRDLMEAFFYLVVGQQDIPSQVDLSDLLTPEELFSLWRCMTSRMYYITGRCPAAGQAGPLSARVLLQDFLEKADAAVAGTGAAATLRFGHDSILIRLLSLLGVEGCTAEEPGTLHYWRAWRDWEVSPMAGNLQWVFFRNGRGEVLVQFLLNENEVRIPALGDGPCYPWAQVRAHIQSLL